jgi:phage protein D
MAQTFSGVNVFINIAGQDYLPLQIGLIRMEVTDTDEGDSEIVLTCTDETFQLIDSPTIKVGALVSVKWGYAGGPQSLERANYVLMKPSARYGEGGVEVTLKAYTKSATLAARRPRKVYGATSVRQVVSEIANRNGLSLTIKGGNEQLPTFSMGSWTDRQTLREFWPIAMATRSATVRTPSCSLPWTTATAPAIKLVYGQGERSNILSADLSVDAHKSHGDSATTATAVDPTKKTVTKAVAKEAEKTVAISAEDGHSWLTSATQSFLSSSTVQEVSTKAASVLPADISQFISTPDVNNVEAVATGEMLKKQKKKGELTIESIGIAQATCRQIVNVAGLAKRDSGNWYVQTVTHSIDTDSGYRCHWELSRHGNNTRTGEPNKPPLNKQTPPGKPADTTVAKVAIDAETGKVLP